MQYDATLNDPTFNRSVAEETRLARPLCWMAWAVVSLALWAIILAPFML